MIASHNFLQDRRPDFNLVCAAFDAAADQADGFVQAVDNEHRRAIVDDTEEQSGQAQEEYIES